ncbi:hypothetical protein L596_027780 [Steinernema carpocapsae]|uniref:Transposase Tc1-like domain-containing protein n=1 Tax=Steinernema carpocapsae TaxID=34508 RepID=A0A4U5LWG6_STECR|nr:hypothetical protein L596_027780 [Steinernema carpocapsae]
MPRFSRDELIETRTPMNLRYGADEIWDRRGRRNWKFESLKSAVRRLRLNGGSVEQKHGSGRPKIAVFDIMSARVQASVTSPPRNPGIHRTGREIAKNLAISQSSVHRNGKKLGFKAHKKVPVHALRPTNVVQRRMRCQALLEAYQDRADRIIFTDEKNFEMAHAGSTQNNRVFSTEKNADIPIKR